MRAKCSVEVCDRAAEHIGLCGGHYSRKRTGGDMTTPINGPYRPKPDCLVEGCPNVSRTVGLCGTHYTRSIKGLDIQAPVEQKRRPGDPLPECSVEGCARPFRTKGMCSMHYTRTWLGKDVLDPIRSTARPGTRTARDERGRKQCSECEHWKPESSFGPMGRSGDGLRAHCRECARSVTMRQKYGISLIEFDMHFAAQGYACAICESTDPKGRDWWCVDHDHACCPTATTCGKCIRGIVCDSCNVGLARFDDSVEQLRSAAEYLERFAGSRT